jgi:hypothetical protein
MPDFGLSEVHFYAKPEKSRCFLRAPKIRFRFALRQRARFSGRVVKQRGPALLLPVGIKG